jgi:uncharacterized alkaline shock family protein YloU
MLRGFPVPHTKALTKDTLKMEQANLDNLMFSSAAAAKIAAIAASETDGIVRITKKMKSLSLANKVRVRFLADTAEFDLSVVVKQGKNAIAIAEETQKAVKSAVQNMTGIIVSKINVRITGVAAEDPETVSRPAKPKRFAGFRKEKK